MTAKGRRRTNTTKRSPARQGSFTGSSLLPAQTSSDAAHRASRVADSRASACDYDCPTPTSTSTAFPMRRIDLEDAADDKAIGITLVVIVHLPEGERTMRL